MFFYCCIIVVFLSCPLAFSQQAYKPGTRYEELIIKLTDQLKARQAGLKTKLAQLESSIGKKTALSGLLKNSKQLSETLQASQDKLQKRLDKLLKEKKDIKDNTLNIKDAAQEDMLIKKRVIQNNIDDFQEKLDDAKKVEQFFEKQKENKMVGSKESLSTFQKKWKDKKLKLEQRLAQLTKELSKLS